MNTRICVDQYRLRDIFGLLILAALFLIGSVNCLALKAAVRSDREAEGFLEKYGYLHEDHAHNAVEIQSAVREFQWLTHLPVTGRLDGATLRQMGAPRCGVKDDGSHQVWAQRVNGIFTGSGAPSMSALRRKRYAAPGEKWYKHHLTYRVVNWPQQLAPGLVRLAVRAAFQLWSDVSGLEFQEVTQGPSDIRLAFYSGEHNDGTSNAFDGPGGALAHAFFPRRGEAHFDKAERWTLNSHKGHNLFMVMAHEIGHTLGLEHSPVQHALMSPYYRKLGRGLVLSWDDITAVQQLYGKPLQGPAVRLPSRALSSALQKWEQAEVEAAAGSALPLYCQGGFDAVTTDQNGTVFIFRGNLFWKVSPEGDAGTPLPLQQHWPLLPLTIEAAAFSPLDNKWYFFKGKRVWCYSSLGLEAGFPKKTSKLGLPHHPDSAFYYAPLGHLVLFKGSRYSVLNLGQLYLEPYYPRRLDDWTGVPQDTNGGLTRSDGGLYLFREQQYWRFDPVKVRVTRKGQWGQDLPWMGCRGNAPQGNDIV